MLNVETAVGDIQDKMVTEERQILAQREKANRKRRLCFLEYYPSSSHQVRNLKSRQ